MLINILHNLLTLSHVVELKDSQIHLQAVAWTVVTGAIARNLEYEEAMKNIEKHSKNSRHAHNSTGIPQLDKEDCISKGMILTS